MGPILLIGGLVLLAFMGSGGFAGSGTGAAPSASTGTPRLPNVTPEKPSFWDNPTSFFKQVIDQGGKVLNNLMSGSGTPGSLANPAQFSGDVSALSGTSGSVSALTPEVANMTAQLMFQYGLTEAAAIAAAQSIAMTGATTIEAGLATYTGAMAAAEIGMGGGLAVSAGAEVGSVGAAAGAGMSAGLAAGFLALPAIAFAIMSYIDNAAEKSRMTEMVDLMKNITKALTANGPRGAANWIRESANVISLRGWHYTGLAQNILTMNAFPRVTLSGQYFPWESAHAQAMEAMKWSIYDDIPPIEWYLRILDSGRYPKPSDFVNHRLGPSPWVAKETARLYSKAREMGVDPTGKTLADLYASPVYTWSGDSGR